MDAAAPRARSAEPAAPDRAARLALWAALAAGIVVRVAYLGAKPLWRDEAWVALLAAEPMRAASEGRPVPLGFLALTRLAWALPLPAEIALRLVPLACGLALLPLLLRLAGALGAAARTAVAAVWLATGLPALVYYSRELKPYGIDVLVAVLVPLLALDGLGSSPRRPARWAFAACLLVAPWVSFGALFPILAVLVWGWAVRWRRASPAARRDWLVASALFAASLGAVYLVAWDSQVTNPRLREFWREHLFANSHHSLSERVMLSTRLYVTLSIGYLFPTVWPALVGLAAIGAWTWPRAHRAFLAWLFLGTAASCVAAAVMDRYLLAEGRLLLFAAPPLLLWSAQGIVQVAQWLRAPGLALAMPAVLGLYWSGAAVAHRLPPYRSDPQRYFHFDVLHDVDPLIARAAALVPAGDPVLVSRHAAYGFQLYAAGRLPQATYCEVYCFDVEGFTRAWLERLGARGWIILIDEEAAALGERLAAAGLDRTSREAARGVLLWEVTRRELR